MATFRWFDRLETILKPGPSVNQSVMGSPTPIAVVADLSYLTSRENNPRRQVAQFSAAPAAGTHQLWHISTLSSHLVGLLYLDWVNTLDLALAAVPIGSITFATGPTDTVTYGDDTGADALLFVQEGTVATANLPTAQAQWEMPAGAVGPRVPFRPVPILFPATGIALWNVGAADVTGISFDVQAIRA